MGGGKDPVQKFGAQYGIRNQEPAETNGGHLQAASPGKIPGPAGASGRIHIGVWGRRMLRNRSFSQQTKTARLGDVPTKSCDLRRRSVGVRGPRLC